MGLFQLAYISDATVPVDERTLSDIRHVAEKHNSQAGVTGMLLHSKGRFMQYLEGPVVPIAELYARICDDPRHSRVINLIFRPASDRLFGDWSMGVYDLDSLKNRPSLEQVWRVLNLNPNTHGQLDAETVIAGFEEFRRQVGDLP